MHSSSPSKHSMESYDKIICVIQQHTQQIIQLYVTQLPLPFRNDYLIVLIFSISLMKFPRQYVGHYLVTNIPLLIFFSYGNRLARTQLWTVDLKQPHRKPMASISALRPSRRRRFHICRSMAVTERHGWWWCSTAAGCSTQIRCSWTKSRDSGTLHQRRRPAPSASAFRRRPAPSASAFSHLRWHHYLDAGLLLQMLHVLTDHREV